MRPISQTSSKEASAAPPVGVKMLRAGELARVAWSTVIAMAKDCVPVELVGIKGSPGPEVLVPCQRPRAIKRRKVMRSVASAPRAAGVRTNHIWWLP